MEKPSSYCDFVASLEHHNVHRIYHDTQYGFPIDTDDELFCRLILEINQAGLSWTTILHKQENFRKAYSNFDVQQVARYDEMEVKRLLADRGIIRNKLKIRAAIHNANTIVELQNTYGSFKNWLNLHNPRPLTEWVKLFKKTFKFTGGEITNEFLMSSGYLPGAHTEGCHIYHQIMKVKPMWNIKKVKD